MLVAGYFNYIATFGAGEPNQTTLAAADHSIFIARYRANGQLAWAKRIDGSAIGYSSLCVAALPDGGGLLTGAFADQTTFGSGEVNRTTLTSAGVNDIFLARYLSDGTLAWVRQAGGTSDDVGQGVSVLSDGGALVTGYISEMSNGTMNRNIFLARYTTAGAPVWERRVGSSGSDAGTAVATLAGSEMLVTGVFPGHGALRCRGSGVPRR